MAELLIMRHGEALPGHPDAERALSDRGRREVSRMAAWLAARDDLASRRLRLLASPYVRAGETAEIVAASLGATVETLAFLTPDDPPEAVIEWLLGQPQDATLMLVSHMPLVGGLAGLLVEGRSDRGIGFATAAVAELEAEVWAGGCARLVRFTAPAELD